MNITHAVHEEVTGDRLKAIFDRQRELWEKYHHIEVKSGLRITEDCPVNLNDRRGQFQIKDYAWRVMEEVGEALDAIGNKEHYQEELVDGLHFLTEMTILAGKDWNTIHQFPNIIPEGYDHLKVMVNWARAFIEKVKCPPSEEITLQLLTAQLVLELGMMCNCLKNKPWKQSMMVTDEAAFYTRLQNVWGVYMAILVNSGLDQDGICDTYLRKSQVNQFRQRSNY